MRLAQLLFKPKWQDKDAAVRRAAVASGSDPDLLEALPRLLREDTDASVRLAALKKLNDYEHWRERSTADADKNVRDVARGTYLAMLCAATTKPTLQRRIAELDTLASDELERVVISATDRELRAAALPRVNKSGLLADRAITDPDPQLRLASLERVEDVNLLERIAERARKTDKAVARRARERVEALRISAGDASAISERARGLCERMDALMRAPRAEIARELAQIDAEWNALGTTAIPAELRARFQGAHALALRASDLLQNPPPAPVPASVEPAIAEPEIVAAEPTEAQPGPALAETLASRARFDAALAAAEAEARNERERRKRAQHDFETCLVTFSAAIDGGNSAEVHRLHARIETDLKTLGDIPSALQHQLAPLQARYAEMKRWQHWSNNQRRRVLCADIEALAGSGLHPDAIATRVRDARDEWQRMNAAEGIGAETEAGDGISRRFHALCQHALRPTRGYFTKRKEVRKSHEEEIAALLERIAAIGDDSTDWKGVAALRTESGAALRSLDEVPPQARTSLAKRLKDAIARLHGLIEKHEHEVEAGKTRLIEQATALSSRSDGTGAPREVRELQKKWTALGNGRRGTDQRQWREFRAACDGVFGKLDAARKERDAQAAEQRTQAQQAVADLEALAADEASPPDAIRTQLRELDARWQALASDDRALAQRHRQAHDAIAMRLKDAVRRKRTARYTNAMQKYSLLRMQENGTPIQADAWSALPDSAEFDAPLTARHQRALAGAVVDELESAHDLLVQLEYLAGIESPEQDRQRRMNYQVQRLSSRMRGGSTLTSEQELVSVMTVWFRQTPQPEALEQRFESAARAAIDTLP